MPAVSNIIPITVVKSSKVIYIELVVSTIIEFTALLTVIRVNLDIKIKFEVLIVLIAFRFFTSISYFTTVKIIKLFIIIIFDLTLLFHFISQLQ